METVKSVARWYVPLLGIFLILTGIGILFNVAVPAVVLGILALVAGILALLAS